jgi:hypothetical protein
LTSTLILSSENTNNKKRRFLANQRSAN